MKRRTVWIVLLVIIAAVFCGTFEFIVNTAYGQDLTANDLFSCKMFTYSYNENLYSVAEPIQVTIKLQHKKNTI